MKKQFLLAIICVVVISFACACSGKTNESIEVSVLEIVSFDNHTNEQEENNAQELFKKHFEEFKKHVHEGEFEEAYYSAKEASDCGDFSRECLALFKDKENADELISVGYIYLLNDEPLKAAEAVADNGSEACKEFFSFVKDNSYLIEEYFIDAEGYEYMRSLEYDDYGRMTRQQVNGPDALIYRYGKNEVLKSWERDGKEEPEEYRRYDDNGNLVYTYKNGNETIYEYDENGRWIRSKAPNTGLIEQCEYDEAGNAVLEIHSDGTKTIKEYDDAGRCVKTAKESYLGTVVDETVYDDNGRIVKTIDGSTGFVSEYEYDESGNCIAEKYSDGSTKGYEYGKSGVLLKEWGTYYDSNSNKVTYESSHSYDKYGYETGWSETRSDGTYSVGKLVSDAFGEQIKHYSETAYPYQDDDLNIVTTDWEGTNKYHFFIKSKEEEQDKNLYQYVEDIVEGSRQFPVEEEEARNYDEKFSLVFDNLPCGNVGILEKNSFLYCYQFENITDKESVKLVYKKSKNASKAAVVYMAINGEEQLVGRIDVSDFNSDYTNDAIETSSFQQSGGIYAGSYYTKNDENIVSGVCAIKDFSAEKMSVEAEIGDGTVTSFSGGVRVTGLKDNYKKYEIAEDAVLIHFNDCSITYAFVTPELFERIFAYGYEYYIGLKNGKIVFLCPIFSA